MGKKILFMVLLFTTFYYVLLSEEPPFSFLTLSKMDCKNHIPNISYLLDFEKQLLITANYTFCEKDTVPFSKIYETRNIYPHFRFIKTYNDSILIDSCSVFNVFSVYDSTNHSHKFLNEIRMPSINKTIALEYGPSDFVKLHTYESTYSKSIIFSYIITLAENDTYKKYYNPKNIREVLIFSGNGNTLFEEIDKNEVVGIRYFCGFNNESYTRFFR